MHTVHFNEHCRHGTGLLAPLRARFVAGDFSGAVEQATLVAPGRLDDPGLSVLDALHAMALHLVGDRRYSYARTKLVSTLNRTLALGDMHLAAELRSMLITLCLRQPALRIDELKELTDHFFDDITREAETEGHYFAALGRSSLRVNDPVSALQRFRQGLGGPDSTLSPCVRESLCTMAARIYHAADKADTAHEWLALGGVPEARYQECLARKGL